MLQEFGRARTSLTVQGLRLFTFNAGGVSLTLGLGIRIPHAKWCNQKKKKNNNNNNKKEEKNKIGPNSEHQCG